MSNKLLKVGGTNPNGLATGFNTDENGNIIVSNLSGIQEIAGIIPEPHSPEYVGPIAVFGRKVMSKKPYISTRDLSRFSVNKIQRDGNNYYVSNETKSFDEFDQSGVYKGTYHLGNIGAVFFEGFAYSINETEGRLEKTEINDLANKSSVDLLQYGSLGNIANVVTFFLDKKNKLLYTNKVQGKLLCFRCDDLSEVYNISLTNASIDYYRVSGITQDSTHMYLGYYKSGSAGFDLLKVRLEDLGDELALNSNATLISRTISQAVLTYPVVIRDGVLGCSRFGGDFLYVIDTVADTFKTVEPGFAPYIAPGMEAVGTALDGEAFFSVGNSVVTMDSEANITSVTTLEENELLCSITQDAFQNIVVLTNKNFYILSGQLHIRGYKMVT